MNLDLWFWKRCLLKDLSTALVAHTFGSITICAILVKDIMGNIHVKLFKFGPVIQEMSFKEKVFTDTGQRLT